MVHTCIYRYSLLTHQQHSIGIYCIPFQIINAKLLIHCCKNKEYWSNYLIKIIGILQNLNKNNVIRNFKDRQNLFNIPSKLSKQSRVEERLDLTKVIGPSDLWEALRFMKARPALRSSKLNTTHNDKHMYM